MTRPTPLALKGHFAEFVDSQIEAGHFASADEVVEAGLRLLEDREEKLKALREAIGEGDTSGRIRNFDSAQFLAEMNGNHKA